MGQDTLRGVNLTGWLALESWVTPDLFAGSGAIDESVLAKSLGHDRYADLVRRHRDEFVTQDDFTRIAARGFNAVRIVVPWYVYGEDGPDPGPYVGCIDQVDRALECAEEIGLKVIFVLGIRPGWAQADGSYDKSLSDVRLARSSYLDVVAALAKRYASRMGFFGFEVADAARPQVRQGIDKGFALTEGTPIHMLRNYYREAYDIIRAAAGPDPVVILPDGGMHNIWDRFMSQRRYQNVWLDCQFDDPSAEGVDGAGPAGIRRLVESEKRHLAEASRSGLPVMVGKWSSALPISESSITPEGRVALERIYASEQIAAYGSCPAWFFQTWKTTGRLAGWDARVALATFQRGMLS